MLQGEERDSSDEEWEAAYAALDPLAQIGWGNRRAEAVAVGANLVRDVFVAADEMHDIAMSEMDGNTVMDEEITQHGDGGDRGEASTSSWQEASGEPMDNMEGTLRGESAIVGKVFCKSEICTVMHKPLCIYILSFLCATHPTMCPTIFPAIHS